MRKYTILNEKNYDGYSLKQLNDLYDSMSEDNSDEMQRNRFAKLILPLYNAENEEFRKWARMKVYQESINLVKFFIGKYYSVYYMEMGEELIQEGLTAVFENVERYDPNVATFSTFLTVYLKNRMHKFVNAKTNNTSLHYGNKMNLIKKVQTTFEVQNLSYSEEDISAATHMNIATVRKIKEMIELNDNPVYLNGGEKEVLDSIIDKSPTPEEEAIRKERSELLIKALDSLPEECKKAILMKYYPEDFFPEYRGKNAPTQEPNFELIGRGLGVKQSMARKIFNRALALLRHNKDIEKLAGKFADRNDKLIENFNITFAGDDDNLLFDDLDDLDDAENFFY